jgi:hypothetical protein
MKSKHCPASALIPVEETSILLEVGGRLITDTRVFGEDGADLEVRGVGPVIDSSQSGTN